MTGYWDSQLHSRLSRRRALGGLGASGLGAVLLAACGGGEEKTKDKASLLSGPEEASDEPKMGGTWLDSAISDVSTWDVHLSSQTTAVQEYLTIYESLTKQKPTRLPLKDGRFPGFNDIVGEMVDSWELAADGQQITFKIRPNHKWDPRPPTSGREVVASDVAASWDRWASISPYANEVNNKVNPLGPVVSVTATDPKTVVMKLAFPYASIIELLAHHSYLKIMPAEVDKFNVKGEARGSGMFFLDSVQPSVGWIFKRNPDWHANEKNRPYLDAIDRRVITDYGTGLTQFEARNLAQYTVNDVDVLQVKGRNPGMIMMQWPARAILGCGNMWPSQRSDSPLADVRVRRAVSMSIDRDLWIENQYNVKEYREGGVPTEVHWHSHSPYGEPSWLDPKGTTLGEGAKYFQHNVEEARKLMSAAGYTKPLPLTMSPHNRGDNSDYEIWGNMLQDSGLFAMSTTVLDYNTAWRDAQRSRGQGFSGFVRNACNGYNEESYFANWFTPDGKLTAVDKPIPVITDLVNKARTELDSQKRLDLLKQVQKEAAMTFPSFNNPGNATVYGLHWPWLRNFGSYFVGGTSTRNPYGEYWYDASRKA